MCRHIAQALELFLQLDLLVLQGCGLLGGGLDQSLQFGFAGDVGATQEVGLLGLTLQAAQLLARLLQTALGCHDLLVELGVTLLAVGEHHVEFFEACIRSSTALLNGVELRLDFVQVRLDLAGTCPGLICLLRQAKCLHLQLVGLRLRLRGFTAQFDQTLAGVAVGGL